MYKNCHNIRAFSKSCPKRVESLIHCQKGEGYWLQVEKFFEKQGVKSIFMAFS